jgi:hypothetical protein
MQIGVEVYLHRDNFIETSATKRSERVGELSRVRIECVQAVLNSSGVDSIQKSGHLLERLFEQELRYTLGPTVRQECTLTDSPSSRRRGGDLKQAFNKQDRN